MGKRGDGFTAERREILVEGKTKALLESSGGIFMSQIPDALQSRAVTCASLSSASQVELMSDKGSGD